MAHEIGMVGRRVFLRLLAAGRNVRLMLIGNVRVSHVVAAPHDHDALDAVAGSEFVDDRIRAQD